MKTDKLISLKPMTVATLKVLRVNDFGAFLNAGTGNSDDDILLHKTQQTDEVKVGDTVNVFLYLDPKKRLTASMRVPKMREGQIARLKVINVTNDGAFVDVGAERGIFMPFAEMVGRPKVGEIVWAKLYVDKSGRLATSMRVSAEMAKAKEKVIEIDAKKILKFMQDNNGILNLNDKSDPREITKTFRISKLSFKRAIGHLLKERSIEKLDNGFKIVGIVD